MRGVGETLVPVETLNDYSGAFLVISHDAYHMCYVLRKQSIHQQVLSGGKYWNTLSSDLKGD